ncbi:glycosyltransferase [Rhizobium sullae]|uniref:glycosyltransferase n=1 Tax=Rhizobium sullae TaxID=50338 RepID=UPI000B35C785|nr:glycosyltransferase family 2 protein [Rhizobium sullae]
MSQPLLVEIAVCTYRRSSLSHTLASIAAIAVPEQAVLRIIVADNDVEESARDAVEAIRAKIVHQVIYLHCPAGNISIARNACLDRATGDYLAFVDDDELVTPGWLTALLATAKQTNAAAVLGPVSARYGKDAPAFMVEGDFHSTKPVFVNGEIKTGYTCNLLLDRNAEAFRDRSFDLALGRCGGEDTAFLADLHATGGKIAFADKALVIEPVAEERASIGWLAGRRFRSGQSHARVLRTTAAAPGLALQIVLAALKALVCFAVSLFLWFLPVDRWRYVLRGILHLGVVAGLLGVREAMHYGGPVPAARSNPHVA